MREATGSGPGFPWHSFVDSPEEEVWCGFSSQKHLTAHIQVDYRSYGTVATVLYYQYRS